MHPNPAFRGVSRDENLGFVRDRGFGVLMVNGDPFPLCSHVPFLLGSDGKSAEMHLVRSNPILGCLAGGGVAARLAVSGPDGYVSPDWYGVPDQVPTWNYVAVHLSGHLYALPPDELSGHLDRLSGFFEAQLVPKTPWGMGKVTPEVLARMMRVIAPVRLDVERVEGTWKLSQNKQDEARLRAAQGVEDAGVAALAALMRSPPLDGNADAPD